MIPYARQEISEEDIEAVVQVLQSDFLTQGPITPKFEQAVALRCHAQYAITSNSATSALHLTYLAMDLGPGDWLWTSPITFVATSNAALHCGAQVDFVDIDSRTYNLCPKALEAKLIQAERLGTLPKIVVAVHFSGQPCDMKAIHALGQRFGFKIIEDASHAIGAQYFGEPIGNCRYSDATIFSFHPVKIITTGEGGMVLTNDAALAARIDLLRNHGVTRDPSLMTKTAEGAWYYQQLMLGFNYRMTDIQAALGLSQLQRLDAFLSRRHEIAEYYNDQLKNTPIVLPYQAPDVDSALHLYVIQTQEDNRAALFNALRAQEIFVNVHYIPVHLQPYYQKLGFKPGQFPVAEHYYAHAISLPMYTGLTKEQQDQVIHLINALSLKTPYGC